MRLRVLGTGSKGNCYLLETDTECLILDAGVSFKEVKKALNFNVAKIMGVCVTHKHLDHAKYVKEYERVGIDVFKPYEMENVKSEFIKMGNFLIRPLEMVHDTACYGYLIVHKDIGSMVYATDTAYVKYKFANVPHLLIECNYDNDLLDETQPKFEHVVKGHMSLQTCVEFVKACNNGHLQNVILCHMSNGNINEKKAIDTVKVVVSKANVYNAHIDKEVELCG